MEATQIVDSIVTVLSSERDPDASIVDQLNRKLSSAIEPINDRLRQCEKLLLSGQRSEAIELCENDPPLLDIVAVLDFPERSAWDDYVEQFFLTPAPALLVDSAAELNEAYTSQLSVQGLLDQFRLHSLSRSPLSVRTPILRQLAERDPNNLAWQQDLQAFEKARLIEIKADVDAIVAKKDGRSSDDLETVAQAERELIETTWAVSRPAKLLDFVSSTHSTMRRSMAREMLQSLAQKLTTAFGAFDIQAGREHRDRWTALANIAELTTTDPLHDLASPALNWIAESDRRDLEEQITLQSISDLDSAIDSGASRLELERLARSATKGGQDLPAALRNRYEARVAYLDAMAKRKSVAIVSSVVVTLLAAAAALAAYYIHSNRVQEKLIRIAVLSTHLDTGELIAAREDVHSCEKDSLAVFQSGEYQALIADLTSAEVKEESRVQHLNTILNDAQETGLKTPTWTNLESALKKTQEAQEIAGTRTGELARVKQVENELRREMRKFQEEVDNKYLEEMKGIVSVLDQLDLGQEAVVLRTLEQARALRNRDRVSTELFAELDLVLTRLEGMAKTSAEIQEDEKLFEKITESVGDTKAYTAALEGYLRRFPPPDRPHSEPIRRSLEEGRNIWPGVFRWNGFYGTWKDTAPYNIPVEKASQFASHARRLERDCAGYPFPNGFLEVVEHLESVGRQAGSDNQGLFSSFIALLNNPLYKGIYSIRAKSGEVFYSSKAPFFENGRYIFDYYLDTSLSKKKEKRLLKIEVEIDEIDKDHQWDAPQWKLALEILPLLTPSDPLKPQQDSLTQKNWDKNIESVVQKIRSNKTVDPILKLQLMAEVLQTGMQGSAALKSAFSGTAQTMQAKVDELRGNWINPTLMDWQKRQEEAKDFIVSLDLDKPFEDLKNNKKDLSSAKWSVEYRWVGWVAKNYRGQWECRFKTPLGPQDSGDLLVIQLVDGKKMQFDKIATVSGGRHDLATEGNGLQEGRPVYFVSSPKGDKAAVMRNMPRWIVSHDVNQKFED